MSTLTIDTKLKETMDKAFDFLAKKNYAKALPLFKKLVESNLEDWMKSRILQYIKICERGMDPNWNLASHKDLPVTLGSVSVLINEKLFDEAFEMIDKLDLDEGDGLFLKAEIAAEQEKVEEAETLLKAAIEKNPKNKGFALNSPSFSSLLKEEKLPFLKESQS